MTPINIVIPDSLTTQKAELEITLGGIASEEEKLAVQRKDIQVALQSINTAGQPWPFSPGSLYRQATSQPKPGGNQCRRKHGCESRKACASRLRHGLLHKLLMERLPRHRLPRRNPTLWWRSLRMGRP